MDHKEDCFHLGAKALIYNGEGKVLLLKMHKKDLWDIPGGRVQKNESVEEALKREIFEETGLEEILAIEPLTMALSSMRISLEISNVGLIYAIYTCNLAQNYNVCISSEHKDFGWFEPKKAAELLSVNFPKKIVDKILLRNIAS